MATGTAGTTAPMYHTAQLHYIYKDVTYADASATAISLGYLPAGSTVINAGVVVSVAFNGNATNTLDIGTAADTDGFATILALGTIGNIVADELATSNDLGPYTSDTEIKCVLTSTASASAGTGRVWVTYIAPTGSR